VLGNHDFYWGRFAEVRAAAREISRSSRWLRWLPDAGPVELSAATALVGHDGWADGRNGSAAASRKILNDHLQIGDFRDLAPRPGSFERGDGLAWWEAHFALQEERFTLLRRLGEEAAAELRSHLMAALERRRNILVLTHVPPFPEATWFRGALADDESLPHCSCRAIGDLLLEVMRTWPDRRMTVLCGHTHGQGVADILPNLRVLTGGAESGDPGPQPVVVVE